jgi:hypothetical protein
MADAAGGGVDWSLWVSVASLGFGVVSAVYAMLPYVQAQLHDDEEYRRETARRLRGASLGERYRDSLRRALARLDRWFGEPGSARALGVCVWVAVAYAYASYYIGWGLGGAGDIGGFKMLADDAAQPGRGIAALLAVLLPVAAFYVSRSVARWANRWERRFKACLLWRWRRCGGRRGFAVAYRVLLGFVVFLLLYPLRVEGDGAQIVFNMFFFTAISMVGALAGYHCSLRIQSGFWAIVVAVIVVAVIVGAATVAGSIAVAIVEVAAIAVAAALVGATVAALTLAGVIVIVAGVGTIIIVAVVVEAKTLVAAGILAFIIVALAGNLGSALGVLRPQHQRRGLLWAGGFGTLACQGIISGAILKKQATDQVALFFLLFLLILPLANGLFDWLSWWATRALGRRLLGLLATETSGWQRGWAIAGFGLADLAIAVGLLLAMAYTLALGFEGYNEFAKFQRHEAVFALRPMIEAAAASPWHSGFWLTAMLLTTLLPTFGHGLMLLGSPLGVVFIPDRQRLALAEALDGYEQIDPRKQAALRRRAAGWIIHGRVMGQLAALALLVWLLGRIAAFVLLLTEGGLAAVVAQAAYAGISTAEGLGGVLLGN